MIGVYVLGEIRHAYFRNNTVHIYEASQFMNREMRPIEMTWCLAWSQLSLKCFPRAQLKAACSIGSVTWLDTEQKPGPMMTDFTYANISGDFLIC